MNKPIGWWTTHPSILNVTVAGAWDSNGDGIGDFEGIRQHLGDLVGMGMSGLRFQQVTRFDDDFEWSGLVAQDWFDVDRRYGTLADFERLAADCAARDIRLMVMAVPEYVGWHHPDYLAALQARRQGREDPRTAWFQWEDDGTVVTVWNHPGPDTANPDFMSAYLRHVGFWMDKGIGGWDVDAIASWLNLNLDAVRRLTAFVKDRGGMVTSENFALQHDIIRQSGFNAGTGRSRSELYNEAKATVEHNADYIRTGLATRRELIAHGMFPYQHFGDNYYKLFTGVNAPHKLPMWRLCVAFNAALPDQVWAFANAIAYPTRPLKPRPGLDHVCWGQLDLDEIERQKGEADSPLAFFRRMFCLRANTKALAIGEMEEIPTDSRREIFAALRTSEDGRERAVTIFNFAEAARQVSISLAPLGISRLTNLLSGEETSPDTSGVLNVNLGIYGFKLLRVVEEPS
jgi:hypothetical protein